MSKDINKIAELKNGFYPPQVVGTGIYFNFFEVFFIFSRLQIS